MKAILCTIPLLVIGAALLGCSAAAEPDPAASGQAVSDSADDATVIRTAVFVAAKGQESKLEAALREVEVGMRGEADIQYSNVHVNVDDPLEFLAVGIWKDQAAVSVHEASAHEKTFKASLSGLLAAAPSAQTHSAVGSIDVDRMIAARAPGAVYAFAVVTTKSEANRANFLDHAVTMTPLSRGETGDRFYDFFKTSDSVSVVGYESWATPADEKAHAAAPHVKQFLADVGGDLAAAPKVRHYRGIAR